jgi:predicted enzyme related to lactoylglutathione lyase
MRSVTAHPPGIFCWPELATSHSSAAAEFYAALFNWTPVDMASADHQYIVFQLDGLDVAAAYAIAPRERRQGVRWNSYVSVASADEAAARARQFGGAVTAHPVDVADIGRVAVLSDREGVTFCVWQPKTHGGAQLLGAPGALCWTELLTPSLASAEDFYTRMFGWRSRRGHSPDYVEFLRGTEPVAGVLQAGAAGRSASSGWIPYFAVADVDDLVALARQRGGTTLGPPADVPMSGRFAVLKDPQGAVFGIYGVNEAA